MIYSTLKEVYNVDTFEKKKKKKCKEEDDSEFSYEVNDNKDSKKKDLYIQPVSTHCSIPPSRKQNMNSVKPFLDDELEHYFNFNDYQNNIPKPLVIPKQLPIQATESAPDSTISPPITSSTTEVTKAPPAPIVPTTNTVSSVPASVPSTPSKKDMYYKNLINIGLFVFIGILIIFLCDQITEIAINIGMKKTVAILQPYLMRPDKLDIRD